MRIGGHGAIRTRRSLIESGAPYVYEVLLFSLLGKLENGKLGGIKWSRLMG